ncbi:DMT family transporter [Conexibacter sp. DBS9H8]|uniref:DMT family transporter n=1 Tax=Conexibacter sp. DBS9H8 TaxID=2937801 RepID=UPI00200EA9EC|nr:DMT family transporter [Conexibacter sp. DBS9H8]
MSSSRRSALLALVLAGALWGATVPLSKLALQWLDPAWLTVGRFLIAAVVLGIITRRRLRSAVSWQVAVVGALGFGASVALQNAGIARTSVSHASVLLGVAPVLVAITSAVAGHGNAHRREWAAYALSLTGIGLIAGGGGGGASVSGDLLVLASVLFSAGLIASQPRILAGRDPAAVTAVQFAAAAGFALPFALGGGPPPSSMPSGASLAAFLVLSIGGTVLPFWLFAYGQARVRPQLAGAFINLEPVVGAAIGWVAFSNPVGVGPIIGALAVIAAIAVAAAPRTRQPPRISRRPSGDGLAAERSLLARPWQTTSDPLRWRRDGEVWILLGRHLPDPAEPHPAEDTGDSPVPLLD